MARKSRMTILKRQREQKKAEKAALKRAKRQGLPTQQFFEPQPTVRLTETGIESNQAEEDEVS